MNKIYMIRHGEAAAGWNAHADPDLSDKGRAQAETVATEIQNRTKPLPIYASPLQRCQSTATPLAQAWRQQIITEPRVAEIPSPTQDLTARTVWLRRIMSGTWAEFYADPETKPHMARYKAWQEGVTQALHERSRAGDIVIFSHFIALNVAYAVAKESVNFTSFRPDNASLTIFESDGTRLTFVQQGKEATTKVN